MSWTSEGNPLTDGLFSSKVPTQAAFWGEPRAVPIIVKACSTFLEVSELTCGVTPTLVTPNPPLMCISGLHVKAFDSSIVLPNAFRGACAVTVGDFKGYGGVSELCGRENLIAIMASLKRRLMLG